MGRWLRFFEVWLGALGLGTLGLFGLGLGTLGFSTAASAATLKFCYQDKPLSPYYLGAGDEIPLSMPGATIEHLKRIVNQVPQLQLELVRYPWNRCLKYLQQGTVDALVANYSINREAIGVFPGRQGDPDESKMFTQQHICLVTNPELAKSWNGHFFATKQKVTLMRQTNRIAVDPAMAARFNFVEGSEQANSLEMLSQGRVQAVTQVCAIAGQPVQANSFDPQTMVMLTPPIQQLHGYLVFSHQYIQKNRDIAEQLWQQLAEPQLDIYQKYLE